MLDMNPLNVHQGVPQRVGRGCQLRAMFRWEIRFHPCPMRIDLVSLGPVLDTQVELSWGKCVCVHCTWGARLKISTVYLASFLLVG